MLQACTTSRRKATDLCWTSKPAWRARQRGADGLLEVTDYMQQVMPMRNSHLLLSYTCLGS